MNTSMDNYGIVFQDFKFIACFLLYLSLDVRVAIDVNICMTLNDLTGPDCVYSRRPTDATGIPDFNCHRTELLILVMEAKRKHVLEDMGEQTLPEFYHTGKGKDVVQ